MHTLQEKETGVQVGGKGQVRGMAGKRLMQGSRMWLAPNCQESQYVSRMMKS